MSKDIVQPNPVVNNNKVKISSNPKQKQNLPRPKYVNINCVNCYNIICDEDCFKYHPDSMIALKKQLTTMRN